MRIFYLGLGIICSSVSLFLIVIYLNLLVIGYTFLEFVYFIISKGIVFLLLLGLILIYKGLERIIKNELLLRYNGKFRRQ